MPFRLTCPPRGLSRIPTESAAIVCRVVVAVVVVVVLLCLSASCFVFLCLHLSFLVFLCPSFVLLLSFFFLLCLSLSFFIFLCLPLFFFNFSTPPERPDTVFTIFWGLPHIDVNFPFFAVSGEGCLRPKALPPAFYRAI